MARRKGREGEREEKGREGGERVRVRKRGGESERG